MSYVFAKCTGFASSFSGLRSRTTDDGAEAYSDLYYRCHRILADLFYADDSVKRSLSLPKYHVVLDDVSRHVAPRPQAVYSDRSRLQMLPIFLRNSAPESEIIQEMKDKVYFCCRIYI